VAVRISAVVFDLDGTLLDSLEDIARSMNRALGLHGWPQHPLTTYRRLVGEGVLRLANQVAPEGTDTVRLIEDYQAEYRAAIDRKTRPYPGIVELLAGLAARGIVTAILSNKPHELAQILARKVLGAHAFAAVHGQRPGQRRKPAPEPLLELVRLLGVPPEETVLVGDTAVDMATARAAGLRSVGVSWGFRPGEIGCADLVIDRPGELLERL
jgi:phosphoglycolate phosphatase